MYIHPSASVLEWIRHRRTILPRRLCSPGPDSAQIQALFEAAACAPDHQQTLPWRFVLITAASRALLGEVFAASLIDRDASATVEQIAAAREKAFRSPFLALAICRVSDPDSPVPEQERLVSLGCALQNLMLAATAQGYGSSLTTGKALNHAGMRSLFKLKDNEEAVCFVNVGTVESVPKAKQRPEVSQFLSQI